MEVLQEVREKEFYREKIVEIINNIDDVTILVKIFTYTETHLKILKGEI